MGRVPPTRYDERAADDDTDASVVESFGRRQFLRAGGALAGAVFTAGCLGGGSMFSEIQELSRPGIAATAAEEAVVESFDPSELTAEPMQTRVQTIDDTAVLFQYDSPVPSFETWAGTAEPRDRQSLPDRWRFRFDEDDEGLAKEWQAPDTEASDWQEVPVPLPWDLYDTPGFASYDGAAYGSGTAFRDGFAWYRTRFRAAESWANRCVRLNFLGVNYMAWVFVDGSLVGMHEGGNVPFALDVSDHVAPGEEHVLAIRVYRRPWWDSYTSSDPAPVTDESEIPAGPVDYWPYAGLTREVYLTVTPRVTIAKLLADAREGRLDARVVVENTTDTTVDRQVILDPGPETGGTTHSATITVPGEGVAVATFDIPLPEAAAWTPTKPTLHEATATISPTRETIAGGENDRLTTRYGLRTIEARDGRLLLDGDPIFLKGVNWHEETAERGRSLTVEDYDGLIERLHDLEANFLRNSHYSRHPYLYEAADEAGILVMDEAENMWLGGREQRAQFTQYGLSRALVAAMVWNQHNHPAVGLWSVQNECDPFNPAYADWLADLRATVGVLDRQERPITWAAKTAFDPEFEHADVIGINEYYGYFSGQDQDVGHMLDAVHQVHPDTPILVTENGTWSAPELRGEPTDDPTVPGTPEWQAAKFEAHWDQVTDPTRTDFVAGYTFWNLRDYKQRSDYNRFSYNGISTMGLLSFDDPSETRPYAVFRDADMPILE